MVGKCNSDILDWGHIPYSFNFQVRSWACVAAELKLINWDSSLTLPLVNWAFLESMSAQAQKKEVNPLPTQKIKGEMIG
jgi:hypothetical protein